MALLEKQRNYVLRILIVMIFAVHNKDKPHLCFGFCLYTGTYQFHTVVLFCRLLVIDNHNTHHRCSPYKFRHKFDNYNYFLVNNFS